MAVATDQVKTFLQKISHTNYIVRDHRVHQIRVLPGVTLIDMLYRLAAGYLGERPIELRQIIFKQPVVTSEEFDKHCMSPLRRHVTAGKLRSLAKKQKTAHRLAETGMRIWNASFICKKTHPGQKN